MATEAPGLSQVVMSLHVIDRIMNKLAIMNKKINSLLMILAFISTNAQSNVKRESNLGDGIENPISNLSMFAYVI